MCTFPLPNFPLACCSIDAHPPGQFYRRWGLCPPHATRPAFIIQRHYEDVIVQCEWAQEKNLAPEQICRNVTRGFDIISGERCNECLQTEVGWVNIHSEMITLEYELWLSVDAANLDTKPALETEGPYEPIRWYVPNEQFLAWMQRV